MTLQCFGLKPNGRLRASTVSELLAREVALLALRPSDRNGNLAFEKPDYRRRSVLPTDRKHQVDMIRYQMAFRNLALLLPRKFAEDILQLPS